MTFCNRQENPAGPGPGGVGGGTRGRARPGKLVTRMGMGVSGVNHAEIGGQ